MDYGNIAVQAAELEQLLPQLARRLFALDMDHPAAELSIAQLRICTILENGATTMSDLGHALGISMSAVTQVSDRLVRAGLAARVPDADDRRIRQLMLTEHGIEVMRERRMRRVQDAVIALQAVPPERRERIVMALRDLHSAAREVTCHHSPHP
ncbi:MAG: MarR family winged helix-turn-helix transcriptional regulator [Capsulimonadaceae bacterium]